MALGVDRVQGTVDDMQADTVAGSFAKAIKDVVDAYTNKDADVVDISYTTHGRYIIATILHK